MNWTNFDRLRQHLTGLLQTPDRFDWMEPVVTRDERECGCIRAHAAKSLGGTITSGDGAGDLMRFLAISYGHAFDLYVPKTAPERGTDGIRAAIKRLDEISGHYARPTEPQRPFAPNEAHFLASVRALIGQPLAEVE